MPSRLEGEYRIARSGGRMVAGVGQAPQGLPAVWTTYIRVEDVNRTVADATAAGGGILFGPAEAGREGQLAVLGDPASCSGARVEIPRPTRVSAPTGSSGCCSRLLCMGLTGQTIGISPSARSEAMRRLCSHLIASMPSMCRFGPHRSSPTVKGFGVAQ